MSFYPYKSRKLQLHPADRLQQKPHKNNVQRVITTWKETHFSSCSEELGFSHVSQRTPPAGTLFFHAGSSSCPKVGKCSSPACIVGQFPTCLLGYLYDPMIKIAITATSLTDTFFSGSEQNFFTKKLLCV